MSGDEDNRHVDAAVIQPFLELQSILARNPHIKNETAWPIGPAVREQLLRVLKCPDVISSRPQQSSGRDANARLVINNEHNGRFRLHDVYSLSSPWLISDVMAVPGTSHCSAWRYEMSKRL